MLRRDDRVGHAQQVLLWVFGDSCGSFSKNLVSGEVWQHGGEDLELQVFLIAEAVRSPLEDPDLVVESLGKSSYCKVDCRSFGRPCGIVRICIATSTFPADPKETLEAPFLLGTIEVL